MKQYYIVYTHSHSKGCSAREFIEMCGMYGLTVNETTGLFSNVNWETCLIEPGFLGYRLIADEFTRSP